MRVAVVKSDGRTVVKQLDDWKAIRAEIDGAFLESVPLTPGFICYVDEDGIAKGLPRNQIATEIIERALAKVGRSLFAGDFIKGTAVFVGQKWVDDPNARDSLEDDAQKVQADDDLSQSIIDEYFPMARVETLPKVVAYVHANNYFFDATFNATPWFEQASDEEIVTLASAGWTGEAAESVAHFAEAYSEYVNIVLDYCRRKESQGKPVGFTVEIHPGTALEWVKQNRLHIAEKLEDQE